MTQFMKDEIRTLVEFFESSKPLAPDAFNPYEFTCFIRRESHVLKQTSND